MDTIEDVVRSHVPLLHNQSAKGWHSVYCEVCGDGSRTKGPRGGWLFQDEACFYNCFNCGVDGNFDPTRETAHSKHMWDIFRSFGIPKDEVNQLIVAKLKKEKRTIKKKPRIHLPHIDLPDYFDSILEYDPDDDTKHDLIASAAWEFLWDNYKIRGDDYPFYIATRKPKSSHPEELKLYNSLQGRIIIPAFNNDNLMYWQARLLYESDKHTKYISATVEDSNAVVFGMENMFVNGKMDKPLYVTEGFFDSWHVNGVAVLTNTMKPAKVALLDRSQRPKVVIPDYNEDGMRLAEQAIELGWGISLPDTYPYVDVCKAINQFGKLYVIKSIVDNTYHGFAAKLRLKEFRLKTRL